MSAPGSWVEVEQPDVWDAALAAAGGHPLQSAWWGNARQKVDGIAQLFLAYRDANNTIRGLARVESRKAPLGMAVGWIPRGPTLDDGLTTEVTHLLHAELSSRGLSVCISDPYAASRTSGLQQPRTIWLDLSLGIDELFKNFDTRVRYSVRRAARDGVTVRTSSAADDVCGFYALCAQLSEIKGFTLPGSQALMQELARSAANAAPVSMRLYLGEVGGQLAGGALLARSGKHVHYLWGASDRRYSKYRVSETVQWRVMQDHVAAGMTRYDLEGIDPTGNPGVYEFKRKLGGREVTLHGMDIVPLTFAGSIAVAVGRALGRFG